MSKRKKIGVKHHCPDCYADSKAFDESDATPAGIVWILSYQLLLTLLDYWQGVEASRGQAREGKTGDVGRKRMSDWALRKRRETLQ